MNATARSLLNAAALAHGGEADDTAALSLSLNLAHAEALAWGPAAEPLSPVGKHWRYEGDGAFSFSYINSWYDGDGEGVRPLGWEVTGDEYEPRTEEVDYLKHYESIRRMFVRPAR